MSELLVWSSNFLHLTLHLWDLSGSTSCARCPDCVCAVCESIVQERVPEALTSALAFAQEQCSGTTSTTTSLSSSCWGFWLFWLGVIVGAAVTSILLVSLAFCLRCCWHSTTSSASQQPVAALSLISYPPVGGIARQLTLADGEPANPRTLRQAGLFR